MKNFASICENFLVRSILKISGISLLIFCFSLKSFASSGLYDAYAIFNIKGAGDSLRQYSAFDSWSIGSFNNTETLVLNGAQNKTFKNGISNVTGGQLAYRVYRTGTTAPTYSFINLPFYSNDGGGGNQTWQRPFGDASINLLSGLESGVYTLEVYWQAYTSDGDSYYNNSGNNYKATFTYGYVTNADGPWSAPGTWIGNAVPPTGADVIINHVVNISNSRDVRSIFINSAKSLVVNAAQILSITGGIRGNGAMTVNGTFQLNAGYTVNLTPVYGASSKLIYNSGGTSAIGSEWAVGSGTIGTTAGYPQDIDIQNSTTLNLNAITADRGLAGILTLGTGTTSSGSLTLGGTANKLTVNGNIVIGGNTSSGSSSLTLSSNAASASIEVGGNWTRNSTGIFNPTGRGVIFIGASNSTISTNTSDAFPYLIANKTAGAVVLNNAITVTNTLTVNGSSTFSLNGNSLSFPNLAGSSATATINNGHASTNVTLTVNNTAANTFAGIITNGAAATLGLTKLGAGDLTLSAANSYSGTTNLSGGGKLFLTNNMSLGPLNMLASSSLDLGSGATGFSINFANSNTAAWTGILTVFNWTPSANKIINIAGVAPAGLTSTQLGQINFDNYGVGSKFSGIEVRPAFLYVTLASGAGPLSNVNSWLLNDKPTLFTGTESIYIQPGFNLNTDVTPTIFLRVEVAGTLTMTSQTMTVAAGGDFRIAGTVSMTAGSVINFSANDSLIAKSATASFSSAGTLNFLGAFSITSNNPNALLLPNVNLSASVNFGDNSAIQNGSSLYMLANGFVDTKAPFYATGSNLVYNTAGPYDRGTEWSTTSGSGYPANVRIGTTTTFRLSNGTPATARQMSGSLTIDAGRVFTLEDGAGMSATLTVLGDVNVNGELRLGNAIGGDIKVGGNYTVAANPASVFNNSRAVIFIGSGNQFVTKTGGGIIYFDFFVVNKPSGDVKMTNNTNAYITAPANNSSNLRVLQLISGDIDMNGGIITVQGDGTNSIIVLVDNGPTVRRIYTSTGTGEFRIIGLNSVGVAKFTVVAQNSGKLLFDNNVQVSTTVGVDFGTGNVTTIKSKFRIDQHGYVINNSPNYGTGSVLIYNNGSGGYNRNFEWNTNTYGSFGAGFPDSVIVQNGTPLNLNFYSFTASALGCSGKLWIQPGSSVITGTMSKPLAIGDSLVIDGTLTLSTDVAGDITIGGSWKRTGTFVQNDRMVTFDGSNDGTLAKSASIQASPGQIFSRITINKNTNTSSIRVVDSVTITMVLFLQRGAVTLNNDVIIKSDNINGTARIAQTTTPGNISIIYGTGKFEIQRYLPIANTAAARRWRLLTAPLKSSNVPTINAAWQEGQSSTNRNSPSNTIPGFGTAITKGTTAANGYDQGSTNNPSILGYNVVLNTWSSLTATNTGKITDLPGYMLFVRGDRSIIVAGISVLGSATNLRARGEINIGDVTTALNSSGWQVLGNPYASAINFNSVLYNGVNPGTTAGRTFSLWDPKAGGNNNVGGWVNFTSLGTGFYTITGTNTSGFSNTGVIESGAAFLVPGNGGNFTFSENCKIAASTTIGIASRPANYPINNMDFFTSKLYAVNGTACRLTDVVVNVGSKNFENEVNDKDAPKLFTFSSSENISIIRKEQKLTAELKNRMTANDTIFYHLSKLNQANYQLALIGKDIDNTLVGIVEDKFLKTATIISVSDSNIIPFTVTSDSASASDRFSVVFKSSAGFTNIKAVVVDNNVVVDWNLISEFNVVNYEVERSADGVGFKTVGNLFSKGNSFMPVKYNWIDVSPYHGIYYYRIKAINTNGVATNSNIAKIKFMKPNPTIYIAPNPVTDNIIQLQMNTVAAGKYAVRLLNNAGQVVQTSSINHTGAKSLHLMTLNQSIARGTYQLELSAEGRKTMILQVLIQ